MKSKVNKAFEQKTKMATKKEIDSTMADIDDLERQFNPGLSVKKDGWNRRKKRAMKKAVGMPSFSQRIKTILNMKGGTGV